MNRKFITCLTTCALVLAATTLGAQYTISLSSGSGTAGSNTSLTASLDNAAGGGPIAGWSYGVCDPSVATATALNNADTATVNGGAAAGFENLTLQAGGYTHGVVINLFGLNPIQPNTLGFEMTIATYAIDAAALEGSYPVSFCDVLGAPPVAVVVVVGGASIPPAQVDGALNVVGDPCDLPETFDFVAPTVPAQNYQAAAGIGGVSFNANFSVDESTPYPAGEGCVGAATQGFSMGASHDPSLMDVTSVAAAGPVGALNGGSGPAFESPGIYPNGWTIGIVYSLVPPVSTIDFSTAATAVAVGYSGDAGALSGVEGNTTTPLTWNSGLGSPPVANVIVVGGASIGAGFVNGSVRFNGTVNSPFVGGDCNGDGIDNIADIVWALSELFGGGPTRNCPIACDANGDGVYGIADPIYIANYQFLGGPAPVGPAPGVCDTVPGQSPEDCEADYCS